MSKKRFFLLFFSISCNYLLANTSFANDVKHISQYGTYSSGGTTHYSKMELSGCVTSVSLRDSSLLVNLTYGNCDIEKDRLESVGQISDSFVNIIRHYKLATVLSGKKNLAINVSWKVSHWPLINAVNASDSWPNNIFDQASSDSLANEEFRERYKGLLKKEILNESAYFPFVGAAEKLGCSIALSDNFADPLFVKGKGLTKSMLVKWGVYSSDEATKQVYPLIKGSIEFDIVCQD